MRRNAYLNPTSGRRSPSKKRFETRIPVKAGPHSNRRSLPQKSSAPTVELLEPSNANGIDPITPVGNS